MKNKILFLSLFIMSGFFCGFSQNNPEWLDYLNKGEQANQNKNYSQAIKFYQQAIEKGDSLISPYEMALLLVEGTPEFSPNISKAISLMEISAKHENPIAMTFLGDAYYFGMGVSQNLYQSFDWYRKAAELDDPNGQYKLALMYLDGEGVPQNTKKGLDWLQKAADNGSAAAMDSFAIIYGYGQFGLAEDLEKFVYWSRKGAENGDPQSQYRMGLIYLNGIGGVKSNKTEAIKWFQKSAEQGYELSIIKLAEISN